MAKEVQHFKLNNLPSNPEADSIYYINKGSNQVEIFVTSSTGQPKSIYTGNPFLLTYLLEREGNDLLLDRNGQEVSRIPIPAFELTEAEVERLINLTNTSDLTNDGEDGTNPFITAQDLPTYDLSTINGSNIFQLTKNGTPIGNTIDLSPYLDNTDKFPTSIAITNVETGEVTITFNDNSTITGDFSDFLGGGESTQIVDTLEDLKLIENPTNGQIVETKSFGDSGFPLWKLAELTIFDIRGGETVEQYDSDLDFTGEDTTVYYVDKSNNTVYKWNGIEYARIFTSELGDDVLFLPANVTGDTTAFPSIGDTSRFYRTTRNVSGAGAMYRWDEDSGQYALLSGFDLIGTDPKKAFPRIGFENVIYYNEETTGIYFYDLNTNDYVLQDITAWVIDNEYSYGFSEVWNDSSVPYFIGQRVLFGTKQYKCLLPHISGVANDPVSDVTKWEELPTTLCRFTVGGKERIYESLYDHTAQETLEPNQSNYYKVHLWEKTNEASGGTWTSDTLYQKNDVRVFNGQNYKSVQKHYSRAELDPEVSIREYNKIINNGLGANQYTFITEEVTTLVAGNTDIGTETERLVGEESQNYEFAPFKESYPIHVGTGLSLISESGVIVSLRLFNQATDDNNKAFIPVGTTNLADIYRNARVYVQDRIDIESFGLVRGGDGQAINVGEKLYLLDDGVSVIRPTYSGYDGNGYWKLTTKDKSYLSPADAGARPTQAPNSNPFDCREAIQKINNNIYYPVHIPVNGWYISDSIYLTIIKEHKSDGFGLPLKYNIAGRNLELYNYKTGVIWTDRNIDVVVNRAELLQDMNFNIDCQNINFHTKAAYKIDPRFRNRFQHLDLVVYGNFETLCYRADIGTKALLLDQEDALRKPYNSSQQAYSFTFGVNYASSARIKAWNTRCVFWRKPDSPLYSFFTNGLDLHIVNSDYNKQNVNIQRGYGQASIFAQQVQSRPLIALKDLDETPAMYLEGKINVEVFPMDFGNTPLKIYYYKNGIYIGEDSRVESSSATPEEFYDNVSVTNQGDLLNNNVDIEGNYNEIVDNDIYSVRVVDYPTYFMDFATPNITPGPYTAREVTRRPDIFRRPENLQESQVFPHIKNIDLNIYKTMNPRNGGIVPAFLYNQLIGKDLDANEFYFNSYKSIEASDGTTEIDLNTLEEKSETVAVDNSAEVQVLYPKSVINFTGIQETKVVFSDEADPDNDYVEFYLDHDSLASGAEIKIQLDTTGVNDRYPKAIQLIQITGATIETNITKLLDKVKGKKEFSFRLEQGDYDKLIIRFIGCEHEFVQEVVEDTVGQDLETASTSVPFTGGSYIVQTICDLPTYANQINFLHRFGGQTLKGDLDFTYENSPVWKDINGDRYKIAVNSSGKFVKLFKLAANWEEVEGVVPEIIDTDTIPNPEDAELVGQRYIGDQATLKDFIGDNTPDPDIPSNMFSSIFRGNNNGTSNPQIPVDPRFDTTAGRKVFLSLGYDAQKGLIMFFGTNNVNNSVGFIKLIASGAFAIDYAWDTGNLLPEQVDKFDIDTYTDVDKANVNEALVDTDGSQRITIDASLGAVTLTLPAINVNNIGLKYKFIAYDATNVITINTNGTEEIRRSVNNVSTSDTLVEGDILEIVQKGTYWQVI